MIISDHHRFIFLHIPKCAGTFVRKTISSRDSYGNFFWEIKAAPDGVQRDHAHLTLAQLAALFPHEWEKLTRYRTVAILREPRERFASALLEHLHNFRGVRKSDVTADMAAAQARRIIDRIAKPDHRDDPAYVHFNRQSDYVFLDGRQIVTDLYALGRIDDFAMAIGGLLQLDFDTAVRENSTREFRYPRVRSRVLAALRPLARAHLIPEDIHMPERLDHCLC